MMVFNQRQERGRPEDERASGVQDTPQGGAETADAAAETPQRRFQNLLHATRAAYQQRRAQKDGRMDPFQRLVYECLPDDGAPLPFPHLCLLVTERLHHRFPTRSEKVSVDKAVHQLERSGLVSSERMSASELRTRGYNLSGFYCKMVWKNPKKRFNGRRAAPEILP